MEPTPRPILMPPNPPAGPVMTTFTNIECMAMWRLLVRRRKMLLFPVIKQFLNSIKLSGIFRSEYFFGIQSEDFLFDKSLNFYLHYPAMSIVPLSEVISIQIITSKTCRTGSVIRTIQAFGIRKIFDIGKDTILDSLKLFTIKNQWWNHMTRVIAGWQCYEIKSRTHNL